MAEHHHLATVVKMTISNINNMTLYECLYEILEPKFTGLKDEKVYLFKENQEDIIANEFILSDFFYLKNLKIIRCKVLYPLQYVHDNEYSRIKDTNFIIIKIDPNSPEPIIPITPKILGGKTGCSPRFKSINERRTVNVNGLTHTGMLCFPDDSSTANAPYFAFCSISLKNVFSSSKLYAHDDDPNFNTELADDKIIMKDRKPFTCHNKIREYKP